MKEDFLHYVWKFRKYDAIDLRTTDGTTVVVLSPGLHNTDAGPDFFNGRIRLGEQEWAGNIEIHLKSSDWYAHKHDSDPAYDSVILHVVWIHDLEVFRSDNSRIPTISLQYIVDATAINNFRKLFERNHLWIPCEKSIAKVSHFSRDHWLERLYIERLEDKSKQIHKELALTQNDWEAVLFKNLCANFGLRINKESFGSIAASVDFAIIRKCSAQLKTLEALLFGQAGLLSEEITDEYFMELKQTYEYLKLKFEIDNDGVIPPKFSRLRPPNFPTIRLAQLAALYVANPNLLSRIIEAKNISDYHELFAVNASAYWDIHYRFGVKAKPFEKKVSKPFIDLLIVNCILPIRFCYMNLMGIASDESSIEVATATSPEVNRTIQNFVAIGMQPVSAKESQALLQLKNNYCDKKRCLQCAIGNELLKE